MIIIKASGGRVRTRAHNGQSWDNLRNKIKLVLDDNPRYKSLAWVGKISWKKDRLPTPVFLGFPGGPAGKESACNTGELASIPGLGRSPGEGKGYPLQCFGLKNSMDCIVHGGRKELDMTEQLSLTYIQKSAQISQQFDESCKLSQSVQSVQSLSRVRLFATP